jgi:hypothetical protein
MNGICRSSNFRNLEFGDLLLAGVAGGIGSDMGNPALGVDMLLTRLLHMKVLKAFDDRIGIDLYKLSALNSNGMEGFRGPGIRAEMKRVFYMACERHYDGTGYKVRAVSCRLLILCQSDG